MRENLDIGTLRQWIGRHEEIVDTLDYDLVRKFAATLGLPAGELRVGEEAPPLIHLCLAQPAVAAPELGPDGHPRRGGFLPPIPLPRRMWAGGSFIFAKRLRVGDKITRRSQIVDLSLKQGRTGPLCFVKVEHCLFANESEAVHEIQTLVYRDGTATAAAKPAPAPEGQWNRTIAADPILLFRYSALTFNGHRIHYDRSYATQDEGYPGLVVHGPLQATLLYIFAKELKGGQSPLRFAFRSESALFDTRPVILSASDDGPGRLKLWTSRPGGPRAMVAEAQWHAP